MATVADSKPPKIVAAPIICFLSGLASVGVFFLLALLPGQNIHGGTFTGITFFFGLVVPPVWFVAGVIAAARRAGATRWVGVGLNLAGLLPFVLWVPGALYRVFE